MDESRRSEASLTESAPRGRYSLLLASLLAMPVAQGLVEGEFFEETLYWVVFLLMLLGVMVAVCRSRLARVAGTGLTAFAAAVILLTPVGGVMIPGWGRVTGEIRFAVSAALLGLTSALILHDVLRLRRVTFEAVCGGLCGYLLLGYLWGMLFSATERLAPASFTIAKPDFPPGGGADPFTLVSLMTYYSFATLTTVGYGDVVPVSPLGRSLAWLEAVVGQFYLAVLVARLVAMQLTTSQAESTSTSSTSGGSMPRESPAPWPRPLAGRGRRVFRHAPGRADRG